MKKLISSLLLGSLLMMTIPTPKANAGIIVAESCNKDCDILEAFGDMLGGLMVIGGGSIIGGITAAFAPKVGLIIIASSIVLDADGSLNQDKLVEYLSKKYPFIDNQEVISDLALFLKQKSYQTDYVSLSEDETRHALSSLDLSEEEILSVTSDLK